MGNYVETRTEVLNYTDSKQVTQIGFSVPPVDTENDPLNYIGSLFRKKRGVIFAFGDVKKISEDTIYSRELINVLYLAKESTSTLILITADNVLQRIARFGLIVKLNYPDLKERQAQILRFINTYKSKFTTFK